MLANHYSVIDSFEQTYTRLTVEETVVGLPM